MPKYRIEAAFRRQLLVLARKIIREVGTTEDAYEIQQILESISQSKEYEKLCRSAAMKMVTGLFSDQGHTWRQAAAANSKGRIIYQALRKELQGPAGERLRELIDDTTYRIVTLPHDIGHEVAGYTARESLKGRRASDIAEEIKKMFPDKTRARAELIARTQVSITSTNLTRQRAERYGVSWYVWRAVGDARTRHSHEKMEGVLVNWDDPPAPEDLFPVLNADGSRRKNTLGHYHAGCCPNCRCYPEPIVDLDEITFPARIYMNGRITRIGRKAFTALSGIKV
ncbi:phage minor head protein [Acidaminococcus sp.]|uniref:phage minor head protein n=1 Tax=Acidaminococcus sp. TaxID=1872103 RepID=UPI003D7EBC23